MSVPAMFRPMDATLITILALVAIAFLAGAIGWFAGSRPVADWRARHAERDGEARELEAKLGRIVPELATMSERAARADALAAELDAARGEREGLRAELAALREKAANFEEQKRLLVEARAASARRAAALADIAWSRAIARYNHSLGILP